MTLYLFHGQEEFLMEKDIGKLKSKLLDKTFISMSYKTFDNPSFADLMDILKTPPMMFGNMLVVIECDEYFKSKAAEDDEPQGASFSDSQLSQLEEAFQSVPEQITIVFAYKIDRNSNKKIDTRKKLYKLMAKYCEVREFKQLPTYDKALPTAIIKLAKENELELTSDSAAKIIEVLGANLRVIDNELKKIKLSIYPSTTPTKEQIENICSATQDVFKLVDYFILSQNSKAIKEFNSLIQFQHPLQILALLQSTIARFVNLKLLSKDFSAAEISQKTKMHEYRVKLELEKIKNYKYDDLLQLKKRLVDCEYKIKTGQVLSEQIAFEQLLLRKAE